MSNGDAKINNALMNYLSEHGFTETAKTLSLEQQTILSAGGKNGDSINTQHRRKRAKLFSSSESVHILTLSYKKFYVWIINSLDKFRDDYWSLLWITFYNFYFEFLLEDLSTTAQQFLEEHKNIHMLLYDEEIRTLRNIDSKDKLIPYLKSQKKNLHMSTLLQPKQIVSVSEIAFEMLVSFLVHEKLISVLNILSQKVTVNYTPLSLKYNLSEKEISVKILQQEIESLNANSVPTPNEAAKKLNRISWGVPFELEELYAQSTISKQLLHIKAQNIYPSLFSTKTIASKIRSIRQQGGQPSYSTNDESIRARALYVNIYAPRSDTEYFAPIMKGLIPALSVSDEQVNSDLRKKYKKMEVDGREEGSGSEEPEEAPRRWPSIAFSTVFCTPSESLIGTDISTDSSTIAHGFDTGKVSIFHTDAVTQQTYREELFSHSGPVYKCSISRDARKLLTCSADGSTRLWINFDDSDLHFLSTNAEQLSQLQQKKRWSNVQAFKPRRFGCPLPVWDVQFCPLGYYFATSSSDAIRLYTLETEQEFAFLDEHLSDVCSTSFHPNMHYIISGSDDKTVRVWDLRTNSTVRLLRGHLKGISNVTMDPSGKYLLSSGSDNLTIVWDVANSKIVKVLNNGGPGLFSTKTKFRISNASVSPSGEFIAVGSSDGRVNVYETSFIWGKDSSTNSTNLISDADVAFPSKQLFLKDSKNNLSDDIVRTYRTKESSVNCVKFQNEQVLFASGAAIHKQTTRTK